MNFTLFLYTALSFSLFSFQNDNSYSGVITYYVQLIEDENLKKELQTSKFTSSVISNTLKNLKSLEFELKFNNNESVYFIKENMSVDVSNSNYKSAKNIAGNELIYLNSKENKKLVQKTFIGDKFLISDTLTRNWKITAEKKHINGYLCYKAQIILTPDKINTSGKSITAWFTNEIPVSFGPKGYSGLPGLILELHENNLVFTCSNIKLSKNNIDISAPTEGINISRTKYNEYILKKIQEYGFEKK